MRKAVEFVERHRRVVSAFTLIIAAMTFLAGMAIVELGGHGTAVSVTEAVARYRARTESTPPTSSAAAPEAATVEATSTGATETGPVVATATPTPPVTEPAVTTLAPSDAALPDPGVYSYATSGFEEVGIPGSRRSFPATTTITIALQDCGVDETWQPFKEHSEDNLVCADADHTRLVSFGNDITFYGQTDVEHFACDANASFGSANAVQGDHWTFTCSGTTTATSNAEVIGQEQMDVGGEPVAALHVRVATTLQGQQTGTSTNDYWFALTNSLLLRNTGVTDAKGNGSFGSADYHETYDLTLLALAPQR